MGTVTSDGIGNATIACSACSKAATIVLVVAVSTSITEPEGTTIFAPTVPIPAQKMIARMRGVMGDATPARILNQASF